MRTLLEECAAGAEVAAKSNRAGESVYTAPFVLDMLGWTAEQMERMEWYRSIAEEDRQRFIGAYFQATNEQRPYALRYSALTNTNRRIPVFIISKPVFESDGNYDGHQAHLFRLQA